MPSETIPRDRTVLWILGVILLAGLAIPLSWNLWGQEAWRVHQVNARTQEFLDCLPLGTGETIRACLETRHGWASVTASNFVFYYSEPTRAVSLTELVEIEFNLRAPGRR